MRPPVIYPDVGPRCPVTGIAEQRVTCPVCGHLHDFRDGNQCRCGWEANPEIGLQICDRCEEYQAHVELRDETNEAMCPGCYEDWQIEQDAAFRSRQDRYWYQYGHPF